MIVSIVRSRIYVTNRLNCDLEVDLIKWREVAIITKSEAIKSFLIKCTHNDLSNLYNLNMECQVNVAQDNGEQIEGEYNGRKWLGFTDHIQTWKSFRIPYNANSDPTYTDTPMRYDLESHVEGIGMTGWDWQNRVSRWVAFDFDAIVGHSDKHANKLSVDELTEIQDITCDVSWVTTRLSTSGNGLHLYVFLPDVRTDNHTEHAALGRAVLHLLSAKVGYDFISKVDIVGGNMWVWHRKMRGTNGLKLIKRGDVLNEIPPNWRDHLNVVSGKRRCILPSFITEENENKFFELTGQRTKVKLDEQHKKLISYLEKAQGNFWWDNDHHMLVCHTFDLKNAHNDLQLKGVFETLSTGRTQPDHNCFCFPLRKGAWVIRRYGEGTAEAPTWTRDNAGYTHCYYNREPDLKTLAACHGGIEHPTGGYVFKIAEEAAKTALGLGIDLSLPPHMSQRETKLKINRDGKLVVEIRKETDEAFKGWLAQKNGTWARVFQAAKLNTVEEVDSADFDDIIRHVVASDGTNNGWIIRSEGQWTEEPLSHVNIALRSLGLKDNETKSILGNNIFKPWKLTNLPFQPEYPGDRQWNRNAAQFRFAPDLKKDVLEYPHWKQIFNHIGKNLDSAIKKNKWCSNNGILTGYDYLKCWAASVFQFPFEPLPYLFLYGDQNCGKSILHEALGLLMTRGYKRADQALKSTSGFNGELEKAILCVVEEINLHENKAAYNYIKDFVTALEISIHIKGKTPFMAPNTTHWIQCSNEREACPIFEGDTRITMLRVDPLETDKQIAKRLLLQHLRKEAPDFLSSLLKLELPECNDRLRVPIIETDDKIISVGKSQNLLEQFIQEECYYKPGAMTTVADFYNKFQVWLDPSERYYWTKHKISKQLPDKYIRGRDRKTANWCYGNISFDKNLPDEGTPYYLDGDKLTI